VNAAISVSKQILDNASLDDGDFASISPLPPDGISEAAELTLALARGESLVKDGLFFNYVKDVVGLFISSHLFSTSSIC
jgi:hypothetical protein